MFFCTVDLYNSRIVDGNYNVTVPQVFQRVYNVFYEHI